MPLGSVLARYTKASAVAPKHPSLSCEEQALEFCNVCVSEAAVEGSTLNNTAEWRLKYFHALQLFKDVLFLAVGCPFMFFLCLTPLWFADDWVYEMWNTYYWFCMSSACSLFGRSNMVVVWGCGPEIRTVILWAAISAIFTTVAWVAACGTPMLGFAADLASVFVLLYLPTLYILRVCREEHYSTTTFLLYLIGFSMGALPCCVSAALYSFATEGQTGGHFDMPLYLVVWVCSSALLKGLGKRVWAHAAPNCKVFGPILWVFYVEVAMSCLGIRIFFSSIWSAFSFSMSFVPTAAVGLFKGTDRCRKCKIAKKSIGMHRLITMVEVFTSCVGRLEALTMYVCHTAMQLATDTTKSDIVLSKHSVFREEMVHQNTVDIYRNSQVDLGKPWIAVLSMIQILVVFAVFMALSARLWTVGAACTAKVAPTESNASEARARPSSSYSNGGGEEASNDSADSVHVADSAVHRPRQWWDELYEGEAKIHQFHLLSTFVIQFWGYMLSCVCFVFALIPLVVGATERSRLGMAGESMGDSRC